MFTVPALPAPNALADPAFLASAAGESWVGALAENFPHTRYWRDRSDCWSLKASTRWPRRSSMPAMMATRSRK
jgi:hypothetical protein